MFNTITEEQIIEIENLTKEHHDALVAYGADLYKQGLIKGAIVCVAGVTLATLVSIGSKYVKRRIDHKQSKEEL